MQILDRLHTKIYDLKIFKLFTWGTRILLSIAFIPSGLKKVLGQRFTILDTDDPVGFFFEALYRTGFYWNFLGLMQLLVAILILIPKTKTLGAILYLPIIINIFIIVVSMEFKGTPYIAGFMLIANIYLLFWDYHKIGKIIKTLFEK